MSPNPERPSYRVGHYLKDNGYSIVAVNPTVEHVGDIPSYPSLLDIPHSVEIVNIFRKVTLHLDY